MNNLLYEINEAILSLTEMLKNGEIDEQAYIDTVEGMGAENAIEDIVKSILNLEAEVEAEVEAEAEVEESPSDEPIEMELTESPADDIPADADVEDWTLF